MFHVNRLRSNWQVQSVPFVNQNKHIITNLERSSIKTQAFSLLKAIRHYPPQECQLLILIKFLVFCSINIVRFVFVSMSKC